MSKYDLDPYNILETYLHSQSDYTDIEEACKVYGRKVRDLTLEWAAENADTKTELASDGYESWEFQVVDKESILAGKISKDLEI